MAEVTVSVIGKDLLSGSFNAMQKTISTLTGAILDLSSRAVTPVTIALGNLFTDVLRNGVNSITNLKGAIESFSFIRLNMEMEMTRSSFATLTGSIDTANETLKILREYANYTPFEFTQLTAATRKMLAFGFSVEEITKNYGNIGTGLLDVIGNAASALGAGQEGIDRITRALGQMRGLARVSAEDMNQLIDVGVQGYQILAEQLGMTVAEVREAMKKGALDAEVGISALLRGMMQQYGGGMAEFAKTAEGMSSTLNDFIADIKRTFGAVAYREYAQLLKDVTKLVGSPAFAMFAEKLGVKFGGAVTAVNTRLRAVIATLTTFVQRLYETEGEIERLFGAFDAKMRPFMDILRGLGGIFNNTVTNIRSFIRAFMGLEDVQSVITLYRQDFAYFVETILDMGSSMASTQDRILNLATSAARYFKPFALALRELPPTFKLVGQVISAFVAEFFKLESVKNIIGGAIGVYDNLAQSLRNFQYVLVDIRDNAPQAFASFVRAVIPTINNIKALAQVLVAVGGAIGTFITTIGGLEGVQSMIARAVALYNSLAEVMTLLIPRINAFRDAIPDLVNQFVTFVAQVRAILPLLTDFDYIGGKISELLVNAAKSAFEAIKQYTLIGRIIDTIGQVAQRVGTKLAPFVGFIQNLVTAILTVTGISTAGDFFDQLARGVSALLNVVIRALPSFNALIGFFTGVKTVVIAAVPVVVSLIQGVIAIVVDLVKAVYRELPSITPIISQVFTMIKDVITAIIDASPTIMSVISTIVGAIQKVINGILAYVPEIERIITAVVRGISTVIDALLPVLAPIASAVETVIGVIERVVSALTPMVNPVVAIATQLGNVAMSVVDAFMPLIPTVLPVAETVAGMARTAVEAFLPFKDIVVPALEAFAFIMGGALVTSIASANSLFVILGTQMDSIRPLITPLIQGISSIAGSLIEFSKNISPAVSQLTPVAERIINIVVKLIDIIGTGLAPIINGLMPILMPVFNGLASLIEGLLPALPIILQMTNALVAFLSPTLISMAKTWGEYASQLGKHITNLAKGIQTFIQTGDASGILQTLSEWGNDVFNTLVTLASTLGDLILPVLENALSSIGNWLMTVLPTIDLPGMLSNFWAQNGDKILTGIGNLLSSIRTAIYNYYPVIEAEGGKMLQNALNMLGDLAKSLLDNIIAFMTSPVVGNAMSTLGQDLTLALGRLGETLGKLLVGLLKNVGTALLTYLVDFAPALGAQGLKLMANLAFVVIDGINRLLNGVTIGILRAIGLDEIANEMEADYNRISENARQFIANISSSLDRFSNWWRSLNIMAMFDQFVRDVQKFWMEDIPRIAQFLAQIPDILMLAASAAFNSVVQRFLDNLEETIYGMLNALGLSGLNNIVGAVFSSWRMSIDEMTGTAENALSRIRNWWDGLTDASSGAVDAATSSNRWTSATESATTAVNELQNNVVNLNRALSTSSYDIYANAAQSAALTTSAVTSATAELKAVSENTFTTMPTLVRGATTSIRGLNQASVDGFGAVIENSQRGVSGMMNFSSTASNMQSSMDTAMRGVSTSAARYDFSGTMNEIVNQLSQMGDRSARTFVEGFVNRMIPDGATTISNTVIKAVEDAVYYLVAGGIVESKFYSVGQSMANGLMAGLNANLQGIVDVISGRLGIDAIIGNLGNLSSRVAVLSGQVDSLMQSGGGGGGGGANRASSYTTVNQKNMNLTLTINQTAPKSTPDNIRYAQALAQSKIY